MILDQDQREAASHHREGHVGHYMRRFTKSQFISINNAMGAIKRGEGLRNDAAAARGTPLPPIDPLP